MPDNKIAQPEETPRVPVSKARDEFRSIVQRARYRGESTILTWHGFDVAIVAPLEGKNEAA